MNKPLPLSLSLSLSLSLKENEMEIKTPPPRTLTTKTPVGAGVVQRTPTRLPGGGGSSPRGSARHKLLTLLRQLPEPIDAGADTPKDMVHTYQVCSNHIYPLMRKVEQEYHLQDKPCRFTAYADKEDEGVSPSGKLGHAVYIYRVE